MKDYSLLFLQEWVLYRPVLARVISITELETSVDLQEVEKINKFLDLNDKIKGFMVSSVIEGIKVKGN